MAAMTWAMPKGLIVAGPVSDHTLSFFAAFPCKRKQLKLIRQITAHMKDVSTGKADFVICNKKYL
jgi:hypothetical protein